MPDVSPYRVAAYAAMAAVLLLVGWNSLKAEGTASRDALTNGPAATGNGQPGVDSSGATEATGSEGSGRADDSSFQAGSGGRRIVVDVSGAVGRPGVYGFEHGQRVIDAIRRAGGATRGAFAAGINRAALLADGQQVVVPQRVVAGAAGGEAGRAGGAGAAGRPGAGATEAPISLGSATQAELEEIEGIGPVTAQSILEFRDSQGGVSSIDELDKVSGIGPVTMEALKSRLQP